MSNIQGIGRSNEVEASRRRKDTRGFFRRFSDEMKSGEGVSLALMLSPIAAFALINVPFSGELLLGLTWLMKRIYIDTGKRAFDFPYRVPALARVLDGSTRGGSDMGKGVTYLGNDDETKLQIYAGDSDLRTHMLVLGTTGSGKAQPLDALVHTPTGWVRMGDIQVGDKVSRPAGGTAAVLGVFPQGNIPIFNVTLTDGRQTQACGEHLWSSWDDDVHAVRTTAQLADLLATKRYRQQILLPLPAPVECTPIPCECDLYDLGLQVAMGRDVVVPEDLSLGTISQRYDFLQGLLDATGTICHHGSISVCVESEQIAGLVQTLIWSLGGTARRSTRANSRMRFMLSLRLPEPDRLFRSEIKRDRAMQFRVASLRAELAEITPAGSAEAQCILLDSEDHLYLTDSFIVTHNTEFLLGLVANALVQGTGFIYVDGKGDPKLQKEVFRLSRQMAREDDLLIINFITSGRDFVTKQVDKVTNNMNMMGNTSSGMLIELIVSLMDDGGGGGDMWKGRAISFVAALTRPLIYMRDKGYINLSPEKYLEYFELNVLEELVWEHNGKYGVDFDMVAAPLRTYLLTLPGYQNTKEKRKKQDQKTLEQHGYIVMQLTRIFNDLTFNYGHIFKTKVGDVDFFDVVVNRRLLTVLLPALERAPDSMRMLGKMIVGSIKQMMAGCLGNRVEGVVREIIDSRPTNATFPFYTILDEYGYYAVVGFAVAPAQARSLGFSVIFAAQDFSSLKKSSAEEADATWENTNVRAVGRLTSGMESETWRRINGAAGDAIEANLSGFEREMGAINERFYQQQNVSFERRSRLDYNDVAKQQDGEFTFLIGKKADKGRKGGVAVLRGMGFYTAGPAPKMMRINDFLPVEAPEPADLPKNRAALDTLSLDVMSGTFNDKVMRVIEGSKVLRDMSAMFEVNHGEHKEHLSRQDITGAVLGWIVAGCNTHQVSSLPSGGGSFSNSDKPLSDEVSIDAAAVDFETDGMSAGQMAVIRQVLSAAPVTVSAVPEGTENDASEDPILPEEMLLDTVTRTMTDSPYHAADMTLAKDDEELSVTDAGEGRASTSLVMASEDATAFREKALPLLRQHLLLMDASKVEDDWASEVPLVDAAQLAQVSALARARPYTSVHEKWDEEDRIAQAVAAIDRATRYIDDPIPEPTTPERYEEKLQSFKATSTGLMEAIKSQWRDE